METRPKWLRRHGWDVTTPVEEDTFGCSDEEHLRYAIERGWCLLTFDDDFLSLVEARFSDVEHAGFIFVSQHGRDVGELVQRIDRTLVHHSNRDLSGEIVFA
ncbi:DUF5615 family PIN-like protein [Saliphagus sp. GCM10025334]